MDDDGKATAPTTPRKEIAMTENPEMEVDPRDVETPSPEISKTGEAVIPGSPRKLFPFSQQSDEDKKPAASVGEEKPKKIPVKSAKSLPKEATPVKSKGQKKDVVKLRPGQMINPRKRVTLGWQHPKETIDADGWTEDKGGFNRETYLKSTTLQPDALPSIKELAMETNALRVGVIDQLVQNRADACDSLFLLGTKVTGMVSNNLEILGCTKV